MGCGWFQKTSRSGPRVIAMFLCIRRARLECCWNWWKPPVNPSQEVGGFAVASGPGSFTGLRVGLAAIKALAEVLHKPIAAVSRLEAVAVASGAQGRLMVALDAGRGEVYVGGYEVNAGSAKCIEEGILTREGLGHAFDDRVVVTPDASVAEMARSAGVKVHEIEHPRSDVIAQIGWKKIRAAETVSPEELEANYIRRSDAEIFAKPAS